MKLDMNGIIYALSYALDCIEAEFVGVSVDHAKWVAYLSVVIGKQYGLSYDKLCDLAACAALHDNALTQYIASEKSINVNNNLLSEHCRLGEENIKDFPFYADVTNFLLYHHENANGSGPFGKKAEEIPIEPQIIHFADQLDTVCHFSNISEETYNQIQDYLITEKDYSYSGQLTNSFNKSMSKEKYLTLKNRDILELIDEVLPHKIREYSFNSIKTVMNAFGKILDYKSEFTSNHSIGVAEKMYTLAKYYDYSEELAEKLYIAGALHDIGKMAIKNDILEKPDRLTKNEFDVMKEHASYTYLILSKIKGFEDIARYASHHHEKLNGLGYPFGLNANNLDKYERLLACIDTYQALSENRPYKKGMDHNHCIEIMQDMVKQGFIDGDITEDINVVFTSVTNKLIF